MSKLDSLSDRRRQALQDLASASSIADVARKSNRDPAQLWGMVKGKRPFGERNARALEEELGLPNGYFDAAPSTTNLDAQEVSGWTKVPLIAWEDAKSFSTAKHKDYVFTMHKNNGRCFGVTITDDSMVPTLRTGDVALVDPDIKPTPGNVVLATVNGVTMIGRYKQKSLTTFEICADNTNYPSVSSTEAEVRIIGTVYQMLINAL